MLKEGLLLEDRFKLRHDNPARVRLHRPYDVFLVRTEARPALLLSLLGQLAQFEG